MTLNATPKHIKFIVHETIYENKDCTVMKCNTEQSQKLFIVKRLGFPKKYNEFNRERKVLEEILKQRLNQRDSHLHEVIDVITTRKFGILMLKDSGISIKEYMKDQSFIKTNKSSFINSLGL